MISISSINKKKCEHCDKLHSSRYGSGRFCSSFCAKSYSTSLDRENINKKVSQKLKGRKLTAGGFKKGYDPNRYVYTSADRQKSARARSRTLKERYNRLEWIELPNREKRRRILKEQNYRCLNCKRNTWLNKKLVLELEHKNGNKRDERRKNLCMLCPNCHSQTKFWRRKKSSKILSKEHNTLVAQ